VQVPADTTLIAAVLSGTDVEYPLPVIDALDMFVAKADPLHDVQSLEVHVYKLKGPVSDPAVVNVTITESAIY
jgi:hypothetical protein